MKPIAVFVLSFALSMPAIVGAQNGAPANSVTSFQKVLDAEPGVAKQVAFHRWASPLVRGDKQATVEQAASILEMVNDTDFSHMLTPKEKDTYGIGCRESMTLPMAILARIPAVSPAHAAKPDKRLGINPLLLEHARSERIAVRGLAIRSLSYRTVHDETLSRAKVAQILVDNHSHSSATIRLAVAQSIHYFRPEDHQLLIEAVYKLLSDEVTSRPALYATRSYAAAVTPRHVTEIARVGMRDEAAKQIVVASAVLADIAKTANEATCNAIIDSMFPLAPAESGKYDRSYQMRALVTATTRASADHVQMVAAQMALEAQSKVAFDRASVLTAARELAKTIQADRASMIRNALASVPEASQTKPLFAIFE